MDELRKRQPDFVLILPWNLKAEVIRQLADLREGGTRFVTAVPGNLRDGMSAGRVLLTGGTGLIGRHVGAALRALDYEVVAVSARARLHDRQSSGRSRRGRGAGPGPIT